MKFCIQKKRASKNQVPSELLKFPPPPEDDDPTILFYMAVRGAFFYAENGKWAPHGHSPIVHRANKLTFESAVSLAVKAGTIQLFEVWSNHVIKPAELDQAVLVRAQKALGSPILAYLLSIAGAIEVEDDEEDEDDDPKKATPKAGKKSDSDPNFFY